MYKYWVDLPLAFKQVQFQYELGSRYLINIADRFSFSP